MCKSISVIHYIDKRKVKNNISIDSERAFDKIQYLFIVKALTKVGIEETHLNTINIIYDKLTANIILNSEKLKVLPLMSRTRQGCPFSPFLFSIILEVLTTAIRKERKNKNEREEVKLSLYADVVFVVQSPTRV